jgi:uncharacterized RDD family membrane protein YckC
VLVPRADVEHVRGIVTYLDSGYGELEPTPDAVPPPVPPPGAPLTARQEVELREAWVSGVGRRFVALLLDAIVVQTPILAISRSTGGWPWAVSSVLSFAYYVLMIGFLGQTVGAMALRIRVVRAEDAGSIGIPRAAIREAVLVVPTVLASVVFPGGWVGFVWALVVYVPMFFDRLHQGLHDRAARDLVIRDVPDVTPNAAARRFFGAA